MDPVTAPSNRRPSIRNVRTTEGATWTGQVANKKRYAEIEVLRTSRTRWKRMRSVILQSGETVMYVGDKKEKPS